MTTYNENHSATVTLTPSMQRGVSYIRSVTVTLTESMTKAVTWAKTLSVTVTLTESITKASIWAKTLSATSTVTGGLQRTIGKPISATLVATGQTPKKAIAWTISCILHLNPTARTVYTFKKTLSDVVNLTPGIQRTISKTLSTTTTLTATLAKIRYVYITLAATLTATPSITKNIWAAIQVLVTMLRPTVTINPDGDEP